MKSVFLFFFSLKKIVCSLPKSRRFCMLTACMSAASGVAVSRRAILGRGCDPVRARFAEQAFSARLGVDVDSATTDDELWAKLKLKKYEVLFFVRKLHASRSLRLRSSFYD